VILRAVGEALAWGAAAAAISRTAAIVLVAIVCVWRLRHARRGNVVRALEAAHPEARNILVTADELLRGALTASGEARRRVFARAAAELRQIHRRAVFAPTPVIRAAFVAGAAWILVWAADRQRPLERIARSMGVRSGAASHPGTAPMRLTITVQPPTYTGLPATPTIDPAQIAAVQGTRLTIVVETRAAMVAAEHDGARRVLSPGATGFVDRIEMAKNGYYAIDTDGVGRRVVPLVVSPDLLPSVRVT